MAHYLYRHPLPLVSLFVGIGLTAVPAMAEELATLTSEEDSPWFSCPPPPAHFTAPAAESGDDSGQTSLSADEAVSQAEGVSHFRGNVVIRNDGRSLLGNEATYDQQSGEVTVNGEVAFHSPNLSMQADSANMQMEQESGEFNNVSFYLPSQHGFGRAEQFSLIDPQHSTLQQVQYTTCNPGQENWLLSAKELKLDQQTNTGEAYHTVLRFKGVPLLYSPYLNFPLAGRKSGLLPPTIGSSDSNGTDISLPFYWNIAPNYDATFTPRNMTKRGTMMMSEFRFLTENSEGTLQADHLANDEVYGDDRNYFAADYRADLGPGWSSTLKWRKASDELYLEDLGSNDSDGTVSHLERRLDLNYNSSHWNFLARTQSYQTLSGSEPYKRLPQLKLTGQSTPRPNQLQLKLESEAVKFAHDTRIPTGTRVDLKPSLSLPLQGSAWYLKPTAAWRYTSYRLNDHAEGEQLSRSLPILSLDSGLFFDRETEIAGRAMTHTLEPRLFFLSVPYRDQDKLPRFDTGDTQLSFGQLFRDNRFNGSDRQGDARQVTTALTTRLIDDSDGRERLRASIGRIHYFEDRKVGLNPGDPVETEEYSDIFAELELQPLKQLRLGVSSRYDTTRNSTEQLAGRVRYQPDRKRLLNLDYRYDELEQSRQTDTLLYWPLTRKWQFLSRWRYDLVHDENLDLLGGVEYESCCWAVRLIGRKHRNTYTDDAENSIYLTFEFKGLAQLGSRLEDSLEEGLLDYE